MTSGAHDHEEIAGALAGNAEQILGLGLDAARLAQRTVELERKLDAHLEGHDETPAPPSPTPEEPAPPTTPEPVGLPVPANADAGWFRDHQVNEYWFEGEYNRLLNIPVPNGAALRGALRLVPHEVGKAPVSGAPIFDWRPPEDESPALLRYTGGGTGRLFAGEPANLTIEGLEITGYEPGNLQHGALQLGRGADVGHVYVHDNGATGIRIREDTRLHHFRSSENHHIGLGGGFGKVLVELGSLVGNATNPGLNLGWESGGAKLVLTKDATARRLYCARNRGPGWWWDIDNQDQLIEECLCEFNENQGISDEINWRGTVRRNIARYNGNGFKTQLWGAQILVSSSQGVRVHDNLAIAHNGADGIGVVQQQRGLSDKLGIPFTVEGYEVLRNTIRFESASGELGVVDPRHQGAWDENTIEAPAAWWNAGYGNWEDGWRGGWDEWKRRTGYGEHDVKVVTA